MNITSCISCISLRLFPSVLWRCWFGDRKGILPVESRVLVCWWWRFDWSFARLTAPVVVTTSIILSSNKIQHGDILVPANPGSPGKWPWKWTESKFRHACLVTRLTRLRLSWRSRGCAIWCPRTVSWWRLTSLTQRCLMMLQRQRQQQQLRRQTSPLTHQQLMTSLMYTSICRPSSSRLRIFLMSRERELAVHFTSFTNHNQHVYSPENWQRSKKAQYKCKYNVYYHLLCLVFYLFKGKKVKVVDLYSASTRSVS